jgi:hypothetical protein
MARTDMPLTIKAHTGTTHTFDNTDWGKIHTNRGNAGNIAFTIPAATTVKPGTYFHFFAVAAGTVSFTCLEGIAADNNATADSVTWDTAGEIIGWGARFMSNGTVWMYTPYLSDLDATQTIGDT